MEISWLARFITAASQIPGFRWEKPLAGGEPRRITHFGSGEVRDFRWSRDGKRLLVVWGPTSDDVVMLSGLQ
jgi:hypothetical protein